MEKKNVHVVDERFFELTSSLNGNVILIEAFDHESLEKYVLELKGDNMASIIGSMKPSNFFNLLQNATKEVISNISNNITLSLDVGNRFFNI